MSTLTVLGIRVTDEQIDRWLTYYSPGPQPFRVPQGMEAPAESPAPPYRTELRDTFFMYGGGTWMWLTEGELLGLPPRVRWQLAEERRRRIRPKPVPAWPSDPMRVPKLIRWLEVGARPSLHPLADEHLGHATGGPLPGARELAGNFPEGSGPNCFGTVMTAAGQRGADGWVQLDQFQRWLDEGTDPAVRTDRDTDAGRVLVWRQDGELAHAAVTIGGGWALQKPSQSWSSPVVVVPVDEVIRSWRLPGTSLSRHTVREGSSTPGAR